MQQIQNLDICYIAVLNAFEYMDYFLLQRQSITMANYAIQIISAVKWNFYYMHCIKYILWLSTRLWIFTECSILKRC